METHLFCFVGVAAMHSTSLPCRGKKECFFLLPTYGKRLRISAKSIKKWPENDVLEGLFFAKNDPKNNNFKESYQQLEA